MQSPPPKPEDVRRDFPVCPSCGSKAEFVHPATDPATLVCRDCGEDITAAYRFLNGGPR